MRFTDPGIAASMFAILMAFTNVGLGVGGALVDGIGYPGTLALFAALNLVALPLMAAIRDARAKKPAAAPAPG